MKISITLTLTVLSGLNLFGVTSSELSAALRKNGGSPDVDIVMRCVDDDGNSVSNTFYNWGLYPDSGMSCMKNRKGKTDRDGCFHIKGRTYGEVSFTVKGDGYYATRCDYSLGSDPQASIKDGKWQPYGVTNTVVIRRMQNPIAMKEVFMCWTESADKLPVLGKPCGFDLFAVDWMPPYGKGKRCDIWITGTAVRRPKPDGTFERKLEIGFANPHDGAYIVRMAMFSEFRGPYHADTGKEFVSNIVYETYCDCRFAPDGTQIGPTKYVTKGLDEAEMLVLRLRTVADDSGAVKETYYATLNGPLELGVDEQREPPYELSGRLYFWYSINPTVNDTNLESDTARKNYRYRMNVDYKGNIR